MHTLFGYIKPHGGRMSLQLTIKFVGTVIELFLPWLLSTIIDDCAPVGDTRGVWFWGGVMTLCAGGALVTNIVANRMATGISREITRKLRYDLFGQISALSSRRRDLFTEPSLISRLTSDTYNVHQMVDRMQRLGVRAPILLLGGVVITLSLEPVLALVLIGTLPILGVIVFTVSKKGVPLYSLTQQAVDTLVRKVQENMTGARVIKALSKTDYERGKFDEASREVVRREKRASALMAVPGPTLNLILNTGLALVIVVGAYRVNAGLTQTGKIIAFLSYFTIILNAVLMVSRLFMMYSKGAASAKRIEEVLLAQNELTIRPSEREDTPYHVVFRDVTFSYNKVRDNLTDISFALKRGETLGVIGPTGSGKSTLVNLLMRFYDPDRGEILLNGKRLDSLSRDELRQRVGVAFQNDFLYADTIAENIDFGRGLDQEAIQRAAMDAQADFVLHSSEGFEKMLDSKGSNLSGGQKQRLLVARALAGDPELLILDDSSSALDYKTDAALRRALRKREPRATTVIIAQRVSSVMGADHILVLDDGKAIGYGTHTELLTSCESYREISRVQMGDVA